MTLAVCVAVEDGGLAKCGPHCLDRLHEACLQEWGVEWISSKAKARGSWPRAMRIVAASGRSDSSERINALLGEAPALSEAALAKVGQLVSVRHPWGHTQVRTVAPHD